MLNLKYERIDELPRDQLIELCEMFAKNWLALDGLWFQSIEKKRGMDEAVEHDVNAWARFTETEARRIKAFLGLPVQAGLDGLRRALAFRLYAPLNRHEAVLDGNTLTYCVKTCRVQDVRARKGMAFHPCKPVGLVEYTNFARVIDCRIQTECVSCYPDITDGENRCVWRFTLNESGGRQ